MARNYTKYTKELLYSVVLSSKSLSDVARQLRLKPVGSTFKTIRINLEKFGIDYSHFTGSAWSKGVELKSFGDIKKPELIKRRLINERGYCCESCKLSEWNSLPITLELEHKDGNSFNNQKENLLLLCPNCHAQTATWRRRKP